MRAILKPYTGQYLNDNIEKFYRRFPRVILKAEKRIQNRLGLLPPNMTITFELVDMPGLNIPMVTPTGLTQDSFSTKRVKMSAQAVANDFWGFTSSEKVLIHELVHAYFMFYGGRNYTFKPLWMKEGVALWTADQSFEEDFNKVPLHWRNGRWADYLSYISMFEENINRGIPVSKMVKYLLS